MHPADAKLIMLLTKAGTRLFKGFPSFGITWSGHLSNKTWKNISTDQRLRKKGLDTYPDIYSYRNLRLLNHFLGTWIEEDSEGKESIVDSIVYSRGMRAAIVNQRTQVTYTRVGEEFTLEKGFLDSPNEYLFTFMLEENFLSFYWDGTPMKSVVSQDITRLSETHLGLSLPKFTMTVVREVHGDIMTSITTIGGCCMKEIHRRF